MSNRFVSVAVRGPSGVTLNWAFGRLSGASHGASIDDALNIALRTARRELRVAANEVRMADGIRRDFRWLHPDAIMGWFEPVSGRMCELDVRQVGQFDPFMAAAEAEYWTLLGCVDELRA